MSMELLLNELSVQPLSEDKYAANDKMKQFAEAISEARKKNFKLIRSHLSSSEISLTEDYTLFDWLQNKDVPTKYRNFLFGMITQPFIKDEDEEVVDKYIEANYFFEDSESGIAKTACTGLASAYLYETLSISLLSAPVWNKTKLPIIIENEEETRIESVFNVSSKKSFEDEEIAEYVGNLGNVELVETDIAPKDKKIHLADHHGKKELAELAKQLKNSPYVVEMRSTNWGGKKFIRKTHKDGVIEVVLYKTSKGYALWVQTTGRNLRETKAIAQILDDRYS